jgi:hypothetical protein
MTSMKLVSMVSESVLSAKVIYWWPCVSGTFYNCFMTGAHPCMPCMPWSVGQAGWLTGFLRLNACECTVYYYLHYYCLWRLLPLTCWTANQRAAKSNACLNTRAHFNKSCLWIYKLPVIPINIISNKNSIVCMWRVMFLWIDGLSEERHLISTVPCVITVISVCSSSVRNVVGFTCALWFEVS